jgi:hypothetical protein
MNSRGFTAFRPKSGALGECCHSRLARLGIAVRWTSILVVAECERPHPRLPTGAALALKMRPTTAPSASMSKSSSFHSPDGREAEARLRSSVLRSLD